MTTSSVETPDVIIAVMGPRGAGKSHLIDKLVNRIDKRCGDSLHPKTQAVQGMRMKRFGQPDIVIVDTPGFDDSSKSDMEILNMVGTWLERTYRKPVKLSGILYLHRITDNRMTRAAHEYLHAFGELCGIAAAERVVLVTTMWDKEEYAEAEEHETNLKQTSWKTMIENGSTCARFLNTRDSALELINFILKKKEEREIFLLQQQIVDLNERLCETQAGKTLYATIQNFLSKQEENIHVLAEKDDDESRQQLEKTRTDLQNTLRVARAATTKVGAHRKLGLLTRKGSLRSLKLGG